METILKLLYILSLITFAINTSIAGEVNIESKFIDDPAITLLLTIGEKQDLSKLPDSKSTNIHIYLYSIAKEGGCIPETHMVCSFKYYLALRGDGYGPYSLFDLGEVGEINNIKWGSFKDLDTARFSFQVSNYPKYILGRNKDLKPKNKKYSLFIELDDKHIDSNENINRYKIIIKNESNKQVKLVR